MATSVPGRADLPGVPYVTAPHVIPVSARPRSAPVGTPARPMPLIVDSDPGLDDALAIGLAIARPEIDLLAVTTVGGNADVRHCTENALRLVHAYGATEVPVAEGAAGPLVGRVVRATQVHGEGGIGTTILPPSPARPRPEGAVELIARI
ncbi:MAG TPA: nucleoside hydrolase, partial [Candidatus Limnocylindrales bacterium]